MIISIRPLLVRRSYAITAALRRCYASFSAYYPNRYIHQDRYIKGYLRIGKDGKMFITHPIIHSISIKVLNAKYSYLEASLIVKMRPVSKWLKCHRSQTTFEAYLEECPERKPELSRFLSDFPSLEELTAMPVFEELTPVADIVCVQPYWLMKERAYWGGVMRHEIGGEEVTFLDSGIYAPMLRYDGDIDLSMFGPNDRLLYDRDGPLTRKDTRPLEYLRVDLHNLLQSYRVFDEPFSKNTLRDLTSVFGLDPTAELDKRRDLRNLCVFSIDPPTAKDIDDALSIRKLDDEHYEVGIHIADVSHYVKYNSKICHEAGRRGNSFYLQDKVIHMLPEMLSENLCSLHPGSPKLTVSVLCKVNKEGEVVGEPWIGEAIISSCAKLSYDQSDAVLEGHAGVLDKIEVRPHFYRLVVQSSLETLHELAQKMRARRSSAGAMNVSNVKMSFTGILQDNVPLIIFSHSAAGKSGKLIEEFMLLANFKVAEFLKDKVPQLGLFRQHSPPTVKRKTALMKFFEDLKTTEVDSKSSLGLQATMQKLLDFISAKEDQWRTEDYRLLMSFKFITHMQQAQYVYSQPLKSLRHFGLAIDYYTHFTSPIRRFADIIVHYQLKASLNIPGYELPKPDFLRKYVDVCNERRMTSRHLQWDLADFYLANIVRSFNGIVNFPGYVTKVTRSEISYFCPVTGHSSRVEIKKQSDIIDVTRIKENHYKLTFKKKQCDHERSMEVKMLSSHIFRFDHRLRSEEGLPRSLIVRPLCVACSQENFFCSSNRFQSDRQLWDEVFEDAELASESG